MSAAPTPAPRSRWSGVWLDLVAFVFGLALAWYLAWSTTDLIWSLWLSSLVVGYAILVWSITRPLRELIVGMATDRGGVPAGPAAASLGVLGCGALFMIGFFTVHFGGFHFVHSAFLSAFFPLDPNHRGGSPSLVLYGEVFRRYWWFLPAAFLAQRAAFSPPPREEGTAPAVTPQAIAARKLKPDGLMAPYKNVIRMHLLIFFFAFAHIVGLGSFPVYAVAYAVYFFPWQVLRRDGQEPRESRHAAGASNT